MESGPRSHYGRRIIASALACIGAAEFVVPQNVRAETQDLYIASEAPPYQGAVRLDVPGNPGDVAIVSVLPLLAEGPGYMTLLDGNSDGTTDRSTTNQAPGTIRPNVGAAEIGVDGSVIIKNSSHAKTHLVADSLITVHGEAFSSENNRLFDSRSRGRPLEPNEIVCMPTHGDDGDAEMLNITLVSNHETDNGAGYVTVYAADELSVPPTSNANYLPGETSTNAAVVEVGPNDAEEICIKNSDTGKVHLIVDDQGAFTLDSYIPTPSGAPERKVDTRINLGSDRIENADIIKTYVGRPNDVAILNVTPLEAQQPGFGVVYPSGGLQPNISNANFQPGSVAPALAFVRVGSDGYVEYKTSPGSSDVILDLFGFIDGNRVTSTEAIRLIDTRETGMKITPSPESFAPGLHYIPYTPEQTMPKNPDIRIEATVRNVAYGEHPAQTYTVYKSTNPNRRTDSNRTLLWYTGGGFAYGDNLLSTEYDLIAKYLLSEGDYDTLIAVDYRKTTVAPFPAQVHDVMTAKLDVIRRAESLGVKDISKIDEGGFSAGATIALWSGFGYDDPSLNPFLFTTNINLRPARVLSFAPVMNAVTWNNNPHPWASPTSSLNMLVGASAVGPAVSHMYPVLNVLQYAATSLTSSVSPPPVFMPYSDSDEVINLESQRNDIIALSQYTHLVYNQGGPHGHRAGLDTNLPALRAFIK